MKSKRLKRRQKEDEMKKKRKNGKEEKLEWRAGGLREREKNEQRETKVMSENMKQGLQGMRDW